jgi:predicted permease
MEDFLYVFNGIFPLILIIFLGVFLKKIKLFNDEFIGTSSKLVYNYLLPALIFLGVYDIDITQQVDYGFIILFTLGITFFMFFITLIIVLFVKDRSQRGVILQASFRSNFTIVGLAIAYSLGGESALAIASIIGAISIPLSNSLAVVSLSLFTDNKISVKKIGLNVIKNPLTIAIIVGFILLFLKIWIYNSTGHDPQYYVPFLYTFIQSIAGVTTTFALLILGAQLNFKQISGSKLLITLGVVLRIVIAPLVGFGVLFLFFKDFATSPEFVLALIPLLAAPVAVTSAIMAKELNNDDTLASSIVVISTIGSIFTIFIICLILKGFSLI